MIFIYTTCKDKKEARKIGEILVEEKLAACINYFPIESIYHWQGKIVKDKEFVLLVKTLKNNFQKAEKRVKQLHSYEIPCIVALPIVRSSKNYYNWAKKQTNK